MRNEIKKANIIVIKVGTSVLVSPEHGLEEALLQNLVTEMSILVAQGKKIVLVSSGAVGVGRTRSAAPQAVSSQVAAAIGQAILTSEYQMRFNEHGKKIGQLLLSPFVLEGEKSREGFAKTVHALLKQGVVPVINENDAIAATQSRKFEDNDELSLAVAQAIQADALIMLSDVDGLYSENPLENPDVELFRHLAVIDEALFGKASPAAGSLSRGGILSKLKAAEGALASDILMVLANGTTPEILLDILAGKEVGTLFKK